MVIVVIRKNGGLSDRLPRVPQGERMRWVNQSGTRVTIRFKVSPFASGIKRFVIEDGQSSPIQIIGKDSEQSAEKIYYYEIFLEIKPPVAGPGVIVPPPPPPPPPGKKFFSDYIIGKKGDSLRGKVLTARFIISTVFGRITVKTKDIAHIHFDRPKSGVDEIWLHNGDHLSGKIQTKTVDVKPDWGTARKIRTTIIHTVMIGGKFDGRISWL